jgi:RHS repeat-associated protein
MYKDPFTGLYHTHYRDYDPIHNRWLSEDPAGYQDGLNLYGAYMGMDGRDPLGLQSGNRNGKKAWYAWGDLKRDFKRWDQATTGRIKGIRGHPFSQICQVDNKTLYPFF